MPKKFEIKSEDKFGRLIIIREVDKSKCGKRRFLTKCDCGSEKTVQLTHLRSGNTKSCGCLQKEFTTSHGKTKHRLYKRWIAIKQRCLNTNNDSYKNYGGRGITICEEWKHSFQTFLDDMEDSYIEGYHIDRIDNDKGYSKDNCRWVTRQQNQANRRGAKNSSSKYKGVSKKRNKWQAQIMINGKPKNLGTFLTEEDAAKAYDQAALELHGDYSNLNFKED